MERKNRKVVAVIPARKGSKRLPGKNKRMFYGKPLICWTIEEAQKCEFLDEIIISTDDEDIIELCQKYYEDNRIKLHKLPSECTQDNSKPEESAINTLRNYPNDTIVIWLQPTSPLRSKEDIIGCYEEYMKIKKPLTTCTLTEPKRFSFNGAVYIISLDKIRESMYVEGSVEWLYIMPQERSVDIDTLEEFELAEKLMKKEKEVENDGN